MWANSSTESFHEHYLDITTVKTTCDAKPDQLRPWNPIRAFLPYGQALSHLCRAAGGATMRFSIEMPRDTAAHATPVQLRRGLAYIHYAEGLAQYQRTFDIRVQNIAYAKQ